MSEMVERVARAIAETMALAQIRHNLREINQEDKLEEYLKAFPINVTLADSDLARAAIKAMREPTEAMINNPMARCYNYGEFADKEVRRIYSAMIDEALK